MPRYEYQCPAGHVESRIRPMSAASGGIVCRCGKRGKRILSLTHVEPDGIYSYAPNIGSPEAFERRRAAIKNGQKVIPKIED